MSVLFNQIYIYIYIYIYKESDNKRENIIMISSNVVKKYH